MAHFSNHLNIDVDVYLKYRGNRIGAFTDGSGIKAGKIEKQLMPIPAFDAGEELELHVELPIMPFNKKINGIQLKPGSSLGSEKTKFEAFHTTNGGGRLVYVLSVGYKPDSPIGGDEPQVLHPEDSPIFEEDDG